MYLPKTETAKISRQPTRVHLQGFLGWLVSWGSDNLHQLACYSIHGWKYRAIFSKIKILNYIRFYKLISVDFWWFLIYLSSSYHFHCSYQTKVKRTECILSLFLSLNASPRECTLWVQFQVQQPDLSLNSRYVTYTKCARQCCCNGSSTSPMYFSCIFVAVKSA